MRRTTPFTPADFADRPFGCPPDPVVLELPMPPSVNATRRKDWSSHAKLKTWVQEADNLVLAQGLPRAIVGPFEIHILVSDQCRNDLDNCAKSVIDYVDRIDLIEGDSPRFMRRLVMEFGAVDGCRITIRAAA